MIRCITKAYPIYYKDKLYLRPKVLINNLHITPGTLYNEQNVQRTYSNYGRLQALKYTNIRFFEAQQSDSAKLNAYVMLTRGKHQSVSLKWKAQTLPATWELPLRWLFSTAICSKVPKHSCSSYVGHTRLCPVCRVP